MELVVRASRFPLFAISICALAALAILAFVPQKTHADDMPGVLTQQILPIGQFNSCTPLQVHSFTPYVYGGSLQSFEFTVSDAAYVAIVGSVGEMSVPFQQMSRRVDPAGQLRVHADMDIPVSGSMPISVTLLSGGGSGMPVCISVLSAHVEGSTGSTPVTSVGTEAPGRPEGNTSVKPSSTSSINPPSGSAAATTGTKGEATSSVLGSSLTGLQDVLDAACASTNPVALWIVLLAIYVLIVAGATFWEPKKRPLYWTEMVTATIVAPLVLLFGIWYFGESCRTVAWVPVAAIVIALAGLYGAFRKYPQIANVITLPVAKNTLTAPPTQQK